jgi:hypothetical protein
MRKFCQFVAALLLLAAPLMGQEKRLWVLRPSGELVEYDPTTFAAKQTVKLPVEALKSPSNISVNRLGLILFAPSITLPLSDEDVSAPPKVWFWNGKAAVILDLGVEHKSEVHGSNEVLTELASAPYLATDANHLYWFANEQRRLQREQIDLSTNTTWQAWRTDLGGNSREDLATMKLPECRCQTGSCEESCPLGVVWVPDTGVENFFLVTQFVAGQTTPTYRSTTRYQQSAGKWIGEALAKPVQRVLDAGSGGAVILEAIPDTGCCGWSNQSNDQTLALANGNAITIFDEREAYKNPDYDVSFYTSNAKLSPDVGRVAMTIASTAQAGKPIQLAEQGEANPEESQRIRKTLADLPAVAVKTVADSPKQIAFIPHATLVGWISDNELLIVEERMLVAYNLRTGRRNKSTIRVEDPSRVFLR